MGADALAAARPIPERPGDLASGLFLTPRNFFITNCNDNAGMRMPKVTEEQFAMTTLLHILRLNKYSRP